MITQKFGLSLHQNKSSSIITLSDLAVRRTVQRVIPNPKEFRRGMSVRSIEGSSEPKDLWRQYAEPPMPRDLPLLSVLGFFFASDRLARRDNQDTRARGNLAMRERLRARWGGEDQNPCPKVCRVNVAPKVIVLKELREGWVPSTKGHPA